MAQVLDVLDRYLHSILGLLGQLSKVLTMSFVWLDDTNDSEEVGIQIVISELPNSGP